MMFFFKEYFSEMFEKKYKIIIGIKKLNSGIDKWVAC